MQEKKRQSNLMSFFGNSKAKAAPVQQPSPKKVDILPANPPKEEVKVPESKAKDRKATAKASKPTTKGSKK